MYLKNFDTREFSKTPTSDPELTCDHNEVVSIVESNAYRYISIIRIALELKKLICSTIRLKSLIWTTLQWKVP